MRGPAPWPVGPLRWAGCAWVGLVSGGWALGGCAAIEDDPDRRPSTNDALVSGGIDRGVPVTPRFDRGAPGAEVGPTDARPPPEDAGAGPCTPGMFVDFCSLCGPDGVPAVPEDGRDGQCPPVDCAALQRYEAFVDDQGRAACQVILRNPAGPNCAGLGACISAPDEVHCVERPAVRTAVVELPCQVIVGCEGPTEGTLGPAPVGTPCEAGAGLCTAAGTCDTRITEACGDFAEFGAVCGVGTDAIFGAYCAVAVPVGLGDTTCTAFCGTAGSTCGAAWRAGASACETGLQVGCIDADTGLVCHCRQR